MKTLKLLPAIPDIDGEPMKVSLDGKGAEPLSTLFLLKTVTRAFFRLEMSKMTLDDAEQARAIVRAVKKVEENGEKAETIDLEEAPYKWLLKNLEQHAVALFQINGIQIVEHVKNDLVKVE